LKNINIIGDSHTAKVSYLLPDYFRDSEPEKVFTDYDTIMTRNFYKKNEFIRYKEGLYSYSDSELNISFSYHPGAAAYVFDTSLYKYMDAWNSKDQNVLPFLGYVDVRNYLPRYKNTEEVVSIYVENMLKRFNKANVIFLEPLPQFVTYIINGWRDPSADPDIDFELRYEYHLEFIKCLKEYCQKLGLQDPISSIDILKTDMIEPHLQPNTFPTILNDHLKPKLYKPFLDEILINKKIRSVE